MSLLDAAAEAVPTVIGALIAWAATTATHRTKESTSHRRESVNAVVPRLDDLMQLVRKWDRAGGGARWYAATDAALNAIEAESHRLPPGWRHLRRSVRVAIGEATGTMAFADRVVPDPDAAVPEPCPTWAVNAEEYFCYALERLRSWRDSDSLSARRPPQLLDFDAWLARRDEALGPLAPARAR